MATEKYTPRLKGEYQARIRQVLKEKFGYTNEMQVPKLDKIVLNMGIGEAVADSKKANAALKDLTAIAGQKAVATKAKDYMGLLTPVLKAYLTDKGFHVASLGMQVHGGSGYTEHFPASQ